MIRTAAAAITQGLAHSGRAGAASATCKAGGGISPGGRSTAARPPRSRLESPMELRAPTASRGCGRLRPAGPRVAAARAPGRRARSQAETQYLSLQTLRGSGGRHRAIIGVPGATGAADVTATGGGAWHATPQRRETQAP